MTEELYADLMTSFPQLAITSTTRIEDIMVNAGERRVLAWVTTKLGRHKQKTVSVPTDKKGKSRLRVVRVVMRRVQVAVEVLLGRYDE